MDEVLDYSGNKKYFLKKAREEFEKFMEYCGDRMMRQGIWNIKYNSDFYHDGPKRYGRELTLCFQHPLELIQSSDTTTKGDDND